MASLFTHRRVPHGTMSETDCFGNMEYDWSSILTLQIASNELIRLCSGFLAYSTEAELGGTLLRLAGMAVRSGDRKPCHDGGP
jgi:hypothetical protein